ncbi:MAG: LLM class F420-dependent oxidoreductase [Candidatus Binataceae bacterium]|nr:LLM class F420-dependent oxidoreductase [Candidatus Binataceae bacterium]
MKIGLAAIGIDAGARPAAVQATAIAADRAGFSTLWAGEHVVLFDSHRSRYPYTESGRLPFEAAVDWLDPFITLSFAGAVTTRIRLATGICLLPEHNPLVIAKTIASLDHLSAGRMALGIGIGWMEEEFAALGIPFERRADRTREYVAAMRRLWGEGVSSFHGEFVNFDAVTACPKPRQGARLPIVIGGESGAALRRAAEYGDGWYGLNLSVEEAQQRVTSLNRLLVERGRDPHSTEKIVAPFNKPFRPDDLARYKAAGIDEVVLVESPPNDVAGIDSWVDGLAEKWLVPASTLHSAAGA